MRPFSTALSGSEIYQGCRTPSDLSTFSASSSEPWLSPSPSAREFYEGLRTPDWLEQDPESIIDTQIAVGGGRYAGNARLFQIKKFLMKALLGRSVIDVKPSSPEASSSSSAAPVAAAPSLIDDVLNLLPSAISDRISFEGFEKDKEVLAYMILCSMKNSSLMLEEMKNYEKPPAAPHEPLLHCPCFNCYSSFWLRWDSSPNRELIHSAIEAFEDHFAKRGMKGRKSGKNRGRLPVSKLFLLFREKFGVSTL
ncbi:hypothetical protein H6P81_017254 [Aristolochia fimbriata]|uniref:Uncharacterized protein n=1 Tax=Aristolochia fimbriata TaxID=158543 RepID=A0AAV7DZK8_ARIFI|nr:hypothetical protein H6P81_017254 [Aristolochia fimbriata]